MIRDTIEISASKVKRNSVQQAKETRLGWLVRLEWLGLFPANLIAHHFFSRGH